MAYLPISDAATHSEGEQADRTAFSWSVHLIRRDNGRLPRIAAIVAGTLLLGLCLFHSFWLALAPVLALVFSLSEYLFPVHYSLSAQSAKSQHGLTSLEIRWADVRRAYLTEEGIKLSPLRAKNSRFEPLRGVYLRFDDANRDEVIAAVKSHLAREEAYG